MATNATLRQVVYDVLRSIKENFPDADVSPAQAAFWVILHGDRLRKLHISQGSSGRFLTTFPSISALVDPTTGRNYCILPASIYDFDEDGGIEYLSYEAALDPDSPTFTSVQFTRTTPAESRRLYMSDEEKPKPSDPYYYRSDDRLYFLGCEQIDLTTVEAGLYTNIQAADADLDLDQEFDIPQELIPQVKAEVLAMGLFVKKLPQEYTEMRKDAAINVVTKKDI